MGIRIIAPNGQATEVLRFETRRVQTVWVWCNVQTLQHNLVFGKRPAKQKEDDALLFVVEFSPAAFQALAVAGGAALRAFAAQVHNGKPQQLSAHHLTMNAVMQQCVSAMMQGQDSDDNRGLYLYARVLDLLWLQQENYRHAQQPHAVHVKSEYDKERIIFARDYLLTHLDAPPSLVELAAIAGINEFKLKRGFKELFHQTVFAYLADVRLDMAHRALREKKKTVTQIAFELGFASLQHFSMAFKKKFGVSPREIRD